MKVFLSWSGELSKQYAEALNEWLPLVIQSVQPYFSANDIEKGARWSSEISAELESSAVGIICLTRDNINAPWIMFEAGALSKALTTSKVTPLLFDKLSPTDIQGPLSQFQSATFSQNDITKLIHSLNNSLETSKLDGGLLDESINTWWPRLYKTISAISIDKLPDDEFSQRDERSILKEALQLVRAMYYEDGRYEPVNPLMLRPIEDLKLSKSIADILKGEAIYYIGDLAQRTNVELILVPEMNKDAIAEIKETLASKGLSLGMALQNWPPKYIPQNDEE